MDFKKVTFLKVYTGEDVIVEDMPLFKAVIKEAMRLKLAGGTVTRGIGGYASVKRGIDYKIGSFFTGLPNMPVTVEIVDTRENIEKNPALAGKECHQSTGAGRRKHLPYYRLYA